MRKVRCGLMIVHENVIVIGGYMGFRFPTCPCEQVSLKTTSSVMVVDGLTKFTILTSLNVVIVSYIQLWHTLVYNPVQVSGPPRQ